MDIDAEEERNRKDDKVNEVESSDNMVLYRQGVNRRRL